MKASGASRRHRRPARARRENDMDPHKRVRHIPSVSGVAGETVRTASRAPPVAACFGGIAQLVEHVLCKHEVTGSIPVASTIPTRGARGDAAP